MLVYTVCKNTLDEKPTKYTETNRLNIDEQCAFAVKTS